MWRKEDSGVQALTLKRMNYMAQGCHMDLSSIERELLDDVRGFLQYETVAAESQSR